MYYRASLRKDDKALYEGLVFMGFYEEGILFHKS